MQAKILRGMRKLIIKTFLREPRGKTMLIEILQSAENNNVVVFDTQAMMEGALMVSEMQVRDIMLPSSEITSITLTDDVKNIHQTMARSGHSRFPVFDETGENVLGILLAKDLLASELIDGKNKIKDVLKQYSSELGTEVSIDSFKMLILGQGIEVEEKDFAAEVAATANQ